MRQRYCIIWLQMQLNNSSKNIRITSTFGVMLVVIFLLFITIFIKLLNDTTFPTQIMIAKASMVKGLSHDCLFPIHFLFQFTGQNLLKVKPLLLISCYSTCKSNTVQCVRHLQSPNLQAAVNQNDKMEHWTTHTQTVIYAQALHNDWLTD